MSCRTLTSPNSPFSSKYIFSPLSQLFMTSDFSFSADISKAEQITYSNSRLLNSLNSQCRLVVQDMQYSLTESPDGTPFMYDGFNFYVNIGTMLYMMCAPTQSVQAQFVPISEYSVGRKNRYQNFQIV